MYRKFYILLHMYCMCTNLVKLKKSCKAIFVDRSSINCTTWYSGAMFIHIYIYIVSRTQLILTPVLNTVLLIQIHHLILAFFQNLLMKIHNIYIEDFPLLFGPAGLYKDDVEQFVKTLKQL